SVVNATSGSDGLASVKLEIGNYTANVYFKKTLVGEHWINVTESSLSFNVTCNLTNLKVLVLTVVDEKEFSMPEVRLSLSPENLTSTPNLNTNITGLAVFHNLFLDVNYTLNASRYETQFNTTTIYGLLQNGNPVAWFDLTIYCPIYTLQVNVTNPNANNQPINNALVKIREVMGGLHFEDSTTTDGTAVFNSPLGKYIVEVYGNGIKLNETIVLLNESLIKLPISCKFYGLNIGIQVVDYFGQPIPKANVTLLRNGLENSTFTLPDGRAEFLGLIGGNLTVAIYLPGQLEPYTVSPFYVDSSKTIQIRIERYTMLAGFLVETSHLVMSIIIVVSLIVLLLLEVYRRRRLKPKTSKSES
ncbi:MAG: carboxypeptidase-like regulatory domain-containing protein, partial [Candidatus Bathyarchaeia archaeon]|nr:carboxypeptidase-like regulatory domain-containing protein [Candidatus Bathyarchaeia archaeon]